MRKFSHQISGPMAVLTIAACVLCPGTARAQSLNVVPHSPFTGPEQTAPGPWFFGQGQFRPFDTSLDLAAGPLAQPAVALNTIPGFSPIHLPENVNDGNYGNGSSWIGTTPDSWVKIDLGQVANVDSVLFGRDRLGYLDDRDPGQFTIAVALSDNSYANGDDSNDTAEYTEVFSSAALGFSGLISGADTLDAALAAPVPARFIKLTFANTGAAIDEIEVHGTAAPAVPEGTPLMMLAAAIGPAILCARRRRTRR